MFHAKMQREQRCISFVSLLSYASLREIKTLRFERSSCACAWEPCGILVLNILFINGVREYFAFPQ